MSSTPTAERLKKVMRIALVGIRPADQVLLKGYLRVLLRLEADLEWVSANSPQVDLFMINREFQQADSVQRLLATQPNVATLYIDRDELDQGKLVGNILTLPLKEIDLLNQWLFANVAFLRMTGDTPTPAVIQTTAPASPQTLDQILASRNQANPQSATSPQTQPATNPPMMGVSQAKNTLKNTLVDTLKTLHQRQDRIFTLKQADTIIAYVNPKFQRAWVVDTTIGLTTDWEMVASNDQPAILSQHPIDLVQWLWEKNATASTPVPSLLQSNDRYRITSWLKPLNDDHRHDILKIQGLLESRDSTLDEVIQIVQVSRELAMRTVSGLMVAGLMSPAVYANLSATATTTASSSPMAEPLAQTSLSQPSPSQATLSASPVVSAPTEAMSQLPTTPTQQGVAQDDGMKGFLSKLRRKLGL